LRTGAAAGHRGYFHEAVCYDSADHLLAVVVPFLLGGVAAGEPTVVSLGERNAALVRAALPADSGVEFLTGGDGTPDRPPRSGVPGAARSTTPTAPSRSDHR
jgi:hypothetical protein